MALKRTTVGRFRIERESGSGGMGTIFRALDPDSGRPVALKLVRDLETAELARFEREGRVLSSVKHPGVVRYVDHGVTGQSEAYLAMEWLDGEDLRARLGRAGLSVDEAVTLARKVGAALAALHALGLVHRDIKPANLFLVGKRIDDVRLIDFGLVRGADITSDLTRTGTAVGTPAYMSPEQARGQRDVDARSDLFSLGCVLFKCLTGRAPFDGSGLMALLTKMLLEDVPRVRSLRPEVPRVIDDLIADLTRKNPDERVQTAEALLARLDALTSEDLEGDGVSGVASRASPGLTTGEQRVIAMVLVGAVRPLRSDDATLPTGARVGSPDDAAEALATLAAEYRGHMDQILDGTRVVTFAGAEVASDQAARAAECALAMRRLCPWAPMAVATEWSELHASTPVGDAIERAVALVERSERDLARAMEAGAPGSIAIDPVTAALLDTRFAVRAGALGPELTGLADASSGTRALLGRTTLFVGREWELSSTLAQLREAIEEPAARAVLVTAAAGMGKSRLAREIAAAVSASDPSVVIWSARGDALRAGSPFGMLGQLLRSVASVRLSEPVERRRAGFTALAAKSVPAADVPRVAAFLGEIGGAPFPADAVPELAAARDDLSVMTPQIRRAFTELLAGLCETRPALILLEDLQWGDRSTLRLLDDALRDLERRPWMVLAFARPEVHEIFPRLWAGRSVQEVRLKPLSRKAAEQLVRAALGDHADAETIARVVTQADGNAYYLEELVRAVAARGGSASGSFPGTVIAMAHARFEALDSDVRRQLRAASVFGEVFWPGAVASLLGGGSTSQSFSGLVAARELLVRRPSSRFAGEEELAFRHTLVREAAYAALTPGDRALGHLLAGAWLEAHGETDATTLAHHFDLGGDAGRASVHFLRAATQAMYGLDLEAALDAGTRALAAAPDDGARLGAAELLGELQAWRFDWAAVSQHVDTVLALAPPGGKPWVRAMSLRQSVGLLLGRPDVLMESTIALLAAEPAGEVIRTAVHALSLSVLVLCLVGQHDAAAGTVAKIDALAAPIEGADPIARADRRIAHAYAAILGAGDAWAALAHAEAARAAYVEGHNVRDAMFAACYVGLARFRLGQLDEAERVLRSIPGRELSILTMVRDDNLTSVLVERGAFDEARALVMGRLEVVRASDSPIRAIYEATAGWMLGNIALRAGDPATAEREASSAIEGLRAAVHELPSALAVLAAARLALGRPAEALEAAREAIGALELCGGGTFRGAFVRLVHAEALHGAGEIEAARAAIADARARILAQAARIDDEGAQKSFLEVVPEHARTLALAASWIDQR